MPLSGRSNRLSTDTGEVQISTNSCQYPSVNLPSLFAETPTYLHALFHAPQVTVLLENVNDAERLFSVADFPDRTVVVNNSRVDCGLSPLPLKPIPDTAGEANVSIDLGSRLEPQAFIEIVLHQDRGIGHVFGFDLRSIKVAIQRHHSGQSCRVLRCFVGEAGDWSQLTTLG